MGTLLVGSTLETKIQLLFLWCMLWSLRWEKRFGLLVDAVSQGAPRGKGLRISHACASLLHGKAGAGVFRADDGTLLQTIG